MGVVFCHWFKPVLTSVMMINRIHQNLAFAMFTLCFSEVRVAQTLVFCVVLCILSYDIFSFDHWSLNPAGTPGYRNGTESFFGLKGRPSVVRDA